MSLYSICKTVTFKQIQEDLDESSLLLLFSYRELVKEEAKCACLPQQPSPKSTAEVTLGAFK